MINFMTQAVCDWKEYELVDLAYAAIHALVHQYAPAHCHCLEVPPCVAFLDS